MFQQFRHNIKKKANKTQDIKKKKFGKLQDRTGGLPNVEKMTEIVELCAQEALYVVWWHFQMTTLKKQKLWDSSTKCFVEVVVRK